MKRFSFCLLIITTIISLAACNATSETSLDLELPGDDMRAMGILIDFFQNLYTGEYEEAARLYAGTYENMINHNPEIDPQDHATLLRNACTINGAQCIRVKSIELQDKISSIEYIFTVEFQNADNSLFVSGSCCGEEETEVLYHSVFSFRVSKNAEGNFQVMDMVPYVP